MVSNQVSQAFLTRFLSDASDAMRSWNSRARLLGFLPRPDRLIAAGAVGEGTSTLSAVIVALEEMLEFCEISGDANDMEVADDVGVVAVSRVPGLEECVSGTGPGLVLGVGKGACEVLPARV